MPRQHRHRDRLGAADAGRACRRQPQPDRSPAELRWHQAAPVRRLPRLFLPQCLRQPEPERAREPEQPARRPAAAERRAAVDPEPAGRFAARQPGAPNRHRWQLRLHADDPSELQTGLCAGTPASGLRRRRSQRCAHGRDPPWRPRRHHPGTGQPERAPVAATLAAGQAALRGSRRPHADRAVQHRGHLDLHQPAVAQHQGPRPVVGQRPVHERLSRHAGRGA